jgi:hypothetical protein
MRTQAEIIERIKTAKKNDLFGFECGDYAGRPYEGKRRVPARDPAQG